MYRALFIDESKDEIDDFLKYIDSFNQSEIISVDSSLPLKTIDEMVNFIISNKYDAVISDFMLNELREDIDYNVPYNGVELFESLISRKPQFPFFIITSYDHEALVKCSDVNIIYIKDILSTNKTVEESKAKTKFIERIEMQISNYQKKIEESKSEFNSLLKENSKRILTAREEQRLIDLDDFIEKSIDSKLTLPANIKKSETLNEIQKLISKVDLLIDENS